MVLQATLQIDNDIYNRMSDIWWSEHGFAALLRHLSNPWRVPYFQRILTSELGVEPRGSRALDIGCGGGLLAEEFAAMGFDVTGIDPSVESLEVARTHAAHSGLRIEYLEGHGAELPFEDTAFDVVYCCDVLEHIREWETVIGEAARVLKPGGVFLYDTINRTPASKFAFIKMAQEWRLMRYMPPNLHVWEMFITPEELADSLERRGLRNKDVKGTKPVANLFKVLINQWLYSRSRITAAEFARRTQVGQEGPDINGVYMGYALK